VASTAGIARGRQRRHNTIALFGGVGNHCGPLRDHGSAVSSLESAHGQACHSIATVNGGTGVVSGVRAGSFSLLAVDLYTKTVPDRPVRTNTRTVRRTSPALPPRHTRCPPHSIPVRDCPPDGYLVQLVVRQRLGGPRWTQVSGPGPGRAPLRNQTSNMTPHESGTLLRQSYNITLGRLAYPTSSATTARTEHFTTCIRSMRECTFNSLTATQNITIIIAAPPNAVRGQT